MCREPPHPLLADWVLGCFVPRVLCLGNLAIFPQMNPYLTAITCASLLAALKLRREVIRLRSILRNGREFQSSELNSIAAAYDKSCETAARMSNAPTNFAEWVARDDQFNHEGTPVPPVSKHWPPDNPIPGPDGEMFVWSVERNCYVRPRRADYPKDFPAVSTESPSNVPNGK